MGLAGRGRGGSAGAALLCLLLASDAARAADESQAYPFTRPLLLGAIHGYQKFVSPLRAGRCPMAPSCSRFGEQAFATHNPLVAFVLTADRLHRCSHDLGRYTRIEREDGSFAYDDPVPGTRVAAASFLEDVQPFAWQEPTGGAPVQAGTDVQLLAFADRLRSEGAFAEASVEYRRFLSYFPDSPLRPTAARSLFDTYQEAGLHLKAARWGQTLLAEPQLAGSETADLKLAVGVSFLKLENGPRARGFFDEAAEQAAPPLRAHALLLEGLSLAREDRWRDAQAAFARVSEPEPEAARARRLAELAGQGSRLPHKSPLLAGLLGIVPGLGYLYDGYPHTAVASLIVNGLFFAGTYKAFKGDNPGLGALLSLLSVGWYGGNIYGSVASAQRRNQATRDEFLLKFELGFRY